MPIDKNVFNTEKTDYEKPKLLLGEQESGLFDTINKHYPTIWSTYKTQKSLDWDENEFDYSSCNVEFKTCSASVYEIMIKTLAWQWEADSVASRSIAPVMAPFITSSELWAAIQRISDNEVLHSATYSEIVRSSFDDPSEIIEEVLKVEQAMARMTSVSRVFSEAYKASHMYALGMIENDQDTYNKAFMVFVALLCLERIQFASSFAVTFAICDTGMFAPIGKAVQKIAQDELEVHAEFDKRVLTEELKTERGKIAMEQCAEQIKSLVDEVVQSELDWNGYLFSEGRELVGVTNSLCNQWALFCSKPVYSFLKIKSEHTLPKSNPLKFMENWLDISKTQASPQEQDNGQYKVSIMRRDDEDQDFDIEF
jgi:ribonucleoside-diphosphate reductase beta chain